jgi:hypothetical protein
MQDAQVFAVRPCRRHRRQFVVGHAKTARRKQFGPVTIPGKRAWLAHQPVDDVPIIDAMFAAPRQAWQHFQLVLAVPHFDGVGEQTRLDGFADQAGRHRVDVPLDGDGAPWLHPHVQAAKRLQPPGRQRMQGFGFVVECLLSVDVAARAHFTHKHLVRFPAREVATAAQQQRLLHGTLEAMMALLAVAILVAGVGVDRLRFDLVVRHQRLIATREKVRPRSLNRQRHAIGAMLPGHATQGPHRILEPFRKALETLGETDRHVLPVRVRQHEVIDQVRERRPRDRHSQIVHVREVRGAELAGRVLLRKEDFLGWSARGLPRFDAALQRPQLAVVELAGMPALQFLEEGFGFPAGAGFEQLFDFVPDGGKRIGPRAIRSRRRRGGALRRQSIGMAILACRLAIHARFHRRKVQRRLLAEPLAQLAYLFIGDHRAPPSGTGATRASVNRSNQREKTG